jgi:hypothetical protein
MRRRGLLHTARVPSPLPSLDGRRFVMESSVTFGRFVGTRTGDELAVSFVHVLVADGSVVAGTSGSRVEQSPTGLRLVEEFVIDGVEHVSVCVEEPRPA